LGILLAVLYFFTVYTAVSEEFTAVTNKRVETEKKLKQYQRTAQRRESVARELVRIQSKLEVVKQQMPHEDEMPDLLKQVANFGEGRGDFTLTLFQLEEGSIKDFYKEIPLTIQFRGGFVPAVDFFDRMQNLLQMVDFTDLSMDLRMIQEQGEGVTGGPATPKPMLFTRFVAKTYAYVEGK